MTPVRIFYKKIPNFTLFKISKRYNTVQKFLAGEIFFSKIGQSVYLWAHKTLNLYIRFLGKKLKFVRGGGERPFPPLPLFSQARLFSLNFKTRFKKLVSFVIGITKNALKIISLSQAVKKLLVCFQAILQKTYMRYLVGFFK